MAIGIQPTTMDTRKHTLYRSDIHNITNLFFTQRISLFHGVRHRRNPLNYTSEIYILHKPKVPHSTCIATDFPPETVLKPLQIFTPTIYGNKKDIFYYSHNTTSAKVPVL